MKKILAIILISIFLTLNSFNVILLTESEKLDLKILNTNHELKSDKWLTEIVDSNGETGWFSNINVFDTNKVFISYYDRLSRSLRIAKLTDSNWIVETVDSSGDVGIYASVVVDSIGNPHISYYDLINQDLKYAKWDENNWIITVVDSDGDVGLDTSIEVDYNDFPHISYYDATNGNLKYAKRTGSEWEIEVADSSSNVGAGSSLALDIEGNPHISYKKVVESGLMYAYKSESEWIINNIDPDSFIIWSTSISLDPDSKPHVAYFDVGTLSEEWYLKYAYLTEDGWNIDIVDPDIKNFWYDWGVSIDASNSGIIHIGYNKWSERDMNYAWKLNNKWSIETVDSEGAVGAYSSLDIGPDGYPQISYMDRSNLILKYAKKLEYSPSTPFIPTGEINGLTDKEYSYTTFSSDYDGDNIKYGWNWGDNSDIEWTDYHNSDEIVEMLHSWDEKGVYEIRVKAIDINGFESEWSDRLIFRTTRNIVLIDDNNPPNPPIISGPVNGKIREEYTYNITVSDPDEEDRLWELEVDFGDEIITESCSGGDCNPWDNGATIQIDHIWYESGDYEIKARVMDIYQNWSEWSDPLEISMPHSFNQLQNLICRLINRFPILEPLLSKYIE